MDHEPIIAVQGLTRRFGEVTAVCNVDLEVYGGEILGFLGHNGAGKTTTVRLLNGVLAPSAGQMRVLGRDPTQEGPILRQQTGILTETPSLDERLTGSENLAIYAELYDVPSNRVKTRIDELLTTFGLAGRASDKVSSYSKGMKQRLALARALLHEPALLFLDEPTAGLDPVAARQVHELILRLSHEKGRTVFLCTHNLTEAQELCHRVAVLEQGRLIALGTPTELAHRVAPNLRLVLEVASRDVTASLRVLAARQDLSVVEQKESRLVLTGADREMIPDLVASLVEAGVRIYQLGVQEPSLEDVYFALHAGGPGSIAQTESPWPWAVDTTAPSREES